MKWIFKINKLNGKSLFESVVNCIYLCYKSISIFEIFEGGLATIDGIFALVAYLKLEFGGSSKLMIGPIQTVSSIYQKIVSYLSEEYSEFVAQSRFISLVQSSPCKLTHLEMLLHWNKLKLSDNVVGTIYDVFLSMVDNDQDIYIATEMCSVIVKLFSADLRLKLNHIEGADNIRYLTNYIDRSKCDSAEAFAHCQPWFQIQTNLTKWKASDTLNDQYVLDYLSSLCNVCVLFFDRMIRLLKLGDISAKKRCVGAICAVVESSSLAISFLSENHLSEISSMFIQETESQNNHQDGKIFVKNCVEIFNRIFSNDFCFHKHESLISEIIPKLIHLIGDEMISNKLNMRKSFIKTMIRQESLSIAMLKLKDSQVDYTKKYMENLRLFVKLSLRKEGPEAKLVVKQIVIENLRNIAKEISINKIETFSFLFSLKYWTFEGLVLPSTEIFLEEVLKKFHSELLFNYSITNFLKLFSGFLASMLNYWNRSTLDHELLDILENTMEIFVEFIERHYVSTYISKCILQMQFEDERDYCVFWILILVVKKYETGLSKEIHEKLYEVVHTIDNQNTTSFVTHQLYYLLFANLASNRREDGTSPLYEKTNCDTSQILLIQDNQFYKEKFIHYYNQNYAFNNCLIDTISDSLDHYLVIKLPWQFKLTFKVDLKILTENSHYFEASLRFAEDDVVCIDLSHDDNFYPHNKEESVKLALKITVHLLLGSNLVKCELISSIKDKRVLFSTLMICLFLCDRLLLKSKSTTYLFDCIFRHLLTNLNSQCLQEEISYMIHHVVKVGCVHFYVAILEIAINNLKHNNSSKVLKRMNRKLIQAIVKNTFVHSQWFGSELCSKYLSRFLCF